MRERVDSDRAGNKTRGLIMDFNCLGIAAYVLDDNVKEFRSRLIDAGRLHQELQQRHISGEEIFHTHLDTFRFDVLLGVLAAGDIKLARELATFSPLPASNMFAQQISNLLRSVLGVDNIPIATPEAGDSAFVVALHALHTQTWSHDNTPRLVDKMIREYLRQSRGSGRFASIAESLLPVWVVAVVNLAVALKFVTSDAITDPRLPSDLVISYTSDRET